MKKILLWCLSLMTALSFIGCGSGGNNSSESQSQSQAQESSSVNQNSESTDKDSSSAKQEQSDSSVGKDSSSAGQASSSTEQTSSSAGQTSSSTEQTSSSADTGCTSHDFVLHDEVEGTCNTVGVIAHYTCKNCDTLFDLTKKVINSVEGELDATNHSAQAALVAVAQPTKLSYAIGETFDPTGMTVAYKCANCEGEAIDNQFLTYEYQTAGETAFASGDTKITVKFNDKSFDLEVSVGKLQAEFTNLKESYTTSCCVSPIIDAKSNVPDLPITITYYEGETEVTADSFAAGKSYTAKLSIAGTDTINGTEKTVAIVVEHVHAWVESANDWKQLNYACKCGDTADFYALNYQAAYVDADNLGVDLSKSVVGAENVEIKSVKKVVRLIDGAYVSAAEGNVEDVEYANDGAIYSFAADNYEQPTADEKPYILTLSVEYVIDGVECQLFVEAKLIDKLITTAEDLKLLSYVGDSNDAGSEANFGYYALAGNIDASGVEIVDSNPCWRAQSGFRGTFDGNGYTISNLTVTDDCQGLFGAIGQGAKIENVTFDNVNVKEELYALTFVGRNATFTNVTINFSVYSGSYFVAVSMDDCTLENVTILTDKNADAPFLVNVEAAPADMPETVTINYFAEYTVTFDADGGNEISPVTITEGRRVDEPFVEKYTDEFDYEFLGWYNGETQWDFSAPVTSNMTLVAKWQQVEKTNVLLNAATDSLSKWDYGVEFTAEAGKDEYYGDLWKITLEGDGYEQSFQHPAISTKNYAKVYFYVFNPLDKEVRLVIHGGYGDGWNAATVNLMVGWTLVEVDPSVFSLSSSGQIFLVLQEIDGLSIAGEWKITSFYGLLEGETAPEVQQPETPDIPDEPEIPEEPETNVLLDATTDSLSKWDYGVEFTAEAGKDEYYGDLWKITLEGDGYEQGIQHPAINTRDYVKVYFYVFNPLAQKVRLNIHTPKTWGKATLYLESGWTLVELDAETFYDGAEGQINFIIQEIDAASLAGEWKITSFYGLLEGEEAPEVQQPETPEEPTPEEPTPEEPESNLLLDAATDSVSKWDYGKEFTVGTAMDETYGAVWTIVPAENADEATQAEMSITHTAIDTGSFDKVTFHIYNPMANEVRLVVHGGYGAWGQATMDLAAGWNLVELDVSVFAADVDGQIFLVIQEKNALSLEGEWKITSFYGA